MVLVPNEQDTQIQIEIFKWAKEVIIEDNRDYYWFE